MSVSIRHFATRCIRRRIHILHPQRSCVGGHHGVSRPPCRSADRRHRASLYRLHPGLRCAAQSIRKGTVPPPPYASMPPLFVSAACCCSGWSNIPSALGCHSVTFANASRARVGRGGDADLDARDGQPPAGLAPKGIALRTPAVADLRPAARRPVRDGARASGRRTRLGDSKERHVDMGAFRATPSPSGA